MIAYQRGGRVALLRRQLQMEGSVFPAALSWAFPNALLSVAIHLLMKRERISSLGFDDVDILWSGFNFLVGFLIVFRTSQAYLRFWEGCTKLHQVRSEWWDSASSLIAMTRMTKASDADVWVFKSLIVRLFSMLFAAALAEVEDLKGASKEVRAYTFNILEADAIDVDSLTAVMDSECKTELIFFWIQQVAVAEVDTGLLNIPAPILTRSFQHLSNGIAFFHEAARIASIPFPFPYVQSCEFMLLIHWLMTPFMVAVKTDTWYAAFGFSFVQVFILWSLNYIAVQLENPFGSDANDLDGYRMQEEFNMQLAMLMKSTSSRLPTLSSTAVKPGLSDEPPRCAFVDVWTGMPLRVPASPARRFASLSTDVGNLFGVEGRKSSPPMHAELSGHSGGSEKVKMSFTNLESELSMSGSVNGGEEVTAVISSSKDRREARVSFSFPDRSSEDLAGAETMGSGQECAAVPALAVGSRRSAREGAEQPRCLAKGQLQALPTAAGVAAPTDSGGGGSGASSFIGDDDSGVGCAAGREAVVFGQALSLSLSSEATQKEIRPNWKEGSSDDYHYWWNLLGSRSTKSDEMLVHL